MSEGFDTYGEARDAHPNAKLTRKNGKWVPRTGASFVGDKIALAEHAAERGEIDIPKLMKNSYDQLVKYHGVYNVMKILGPNNELIGLKYRDNDDDPWHGHIDAEKEARKLLELNQARRLGDSAQLEGESGAGLLDRAKASFKETLEGKRNFLLERFGQGNVEPYFKDGEFVDFMVRESQDQPFKRFDPDFKSGQRMSDFVGDLADLSGDVVESVPGMALSAYMSSKFKTHPTAGGAVGGAAGDLLGSAAKQGIGMAIPGEEPLSKGDRIALGATNVAFGLGGEALGAAYRGLKGIPRRGMERLAQEGVNREMVESAIEGGGAAVSDAPQGVLDKITQPLKESVTRKQAADDVLQSVDDFVQRSGAYDESIKEAERLENALDIKFTPGQKSGNRGLLALEQAVRTSGSRPLEAQVVEIADNKAIQQISNHTFNVIEKQFGESVPADVAGRRIATAFKGFIDNLTERRAAVAAKQFNEAFAENQGRAVVSTSNLRKMIRDELDEIAQMKVRGEDTEAVRKTLINIHKKMAKGPIDPRSVNAQLKEWGKGASGLRKIVKGAEATEDRRISKRLFAAMMQDLDETVDAGIGGRKLKLARDTYRAFSEKIEQSQTDLVKKALKKLEVGSTDQLVTDWARPGTSAELLRKTLRVLEEADPVIAKETKGAIAQDLLGRKAAASGSIGKARGHKHSMAKLVSVMDNQQNQAKLRAIFGPASFQALQDIRDAALRIDYTGGLGNVLTSGSATAPLIQADQLLEGNIKATIQGAVLKKARDVLSPRNIVEYIANPEASKILLGITRPKHKLGPTALSRLLAQLSRYAVTPPEDGRIGTRSAELPPVDKFAGGFAP